MDDLLNINESGSLPNTRVADPVAARRIAEDIIDNNQRRLERNQKVKGLVDGNPPYSGSKLKKAGQSYRSNFNSGQALSFLQTSLTAYYDLFSEVSNYATVVCDTGNSEQDSNWSRILTEEFDKLQREDPCLDYGIQLSQHDMVLYGSGPVIWEREDDWVTYPRKHDRVMLDNNEPSDIMRWTKCVVREVFTPADLYRYINNESAARKRGWDVDAVKKSILRATSEFSTYPKDWDRTQQAIRNNDLEFTNPDQVINVARLYFKEFPSKDNKEGGISEVWINLDQDFGFLYRSIRKYDNWKQLICPFMMDRGDGTYHSIKGLGTRMFPFLWTKERLTNSLVDNAFVMASLHIKNQQTGNATPDSMVTMGPFTIWKNNFEPMNFNQIGSSMDAAMSVSRAMDNELQANLAQFKPQTAQPQGNPRTAFEVASTVNQQSVLTKTGIQRFYEQLDDWYAERFRRATRGKLNTFSSTALAAKEFRKRLVELGVPVEATSKCKVTATRTIGQGSHFLRTNTLQQLLGTIGATLPEGGKVNLLDDYIAASAGYAVVDRYNPKNRKATTLQDHEWDAMQENSTMRVGGEVIVTDTQNDVVHISVHLTSVAEGMAAGQNMQEVVAYAMSVMPHTMEHLQRLAADPLRQAEFAALNERFSATQDQLDELVPSLEQQQQAEAIQQGTDPATQLETAKAEHQMRLNEAKTAADIEMNRRRTDSQIEAMQRQSTAK